MEALYYGPEFLPLTEIVQLVSHNADGWVCTSVPELEIATVKHLEGVMGMRIIGVG